LVSVTESLRFGELSCYELCQSCGYIQLLEDYLPSALNERSRYLLHKNDPQDPGYRAWLVSFVDAALYPYAERGCAVLDFGSGPSPALRGILEERAYGYMAYDPFFAPGGEWRMRSWQAIVVHEVAEHLRFPGAVFAELAGLLEPGGIVALRTRFPPESPEAFLSWRYRQDSTHIGFFSKACLKARGEALGLRLVYEDSEDTLSFKKTAYGS
jgi:SAM-dependent methyltransferase